MGASYRYWRARAAGTYGSTSYVTLIEMRVSADGSGPNLTITGNGMASASAGSNIAQAFDGVDGGTSNSWALVFSATGHWAQWDFGAGVQYDLNHFGIKMTNGGNVFTWFFEGSNDGVNWEVRAVLAPLTDAAMTYVRTNQPISIVPARPAQVVAGAVRPSAVPRVDLNLRRLDIEDGGIYRVVGTVKVKGSPNVPVHRRVVLIAERSRRIVRETWSDPVTGAYAFESIRGDVTYTTMAYDHTSAHLRATVADGLTAERMP